MDPPIWGASLTHLLKIWGVSLIIHHVANSASASNVESKFDLTLSNVGSNFNLAIKCVD